MPIYADDLSAQAKAKTLREWFERTQPAELFPTSEGPDWYEHSEAWIIAGFEPHEAIEWMEKGRCFEAHSAKWLRQDGLTPLDAAQPGDKNGLYAAKFAGRTVTVGFLYSTGHLGLDDAVKIAKRERAINQAGIITAIAAAPEPHSRVSELLPREAAVNRWEQAGFRAAEVHAWLSTARCEIAGAEVAAKLRAAGVTPEQAALRTILGHHQGAQTRLPYEESVARKASVGDMSVEHAVELAKNPELAIHAPAIKEALVELRDHSGFTDGDSYAQRWVQAGVRGREVLDWMQGAECFQPEAAGALRAHGITAAEAAQTVPSSVVGETEKIGYRVSCNRMTAEEAREVVARNRPAASPQAGVQLLATVEQLTAPIYSFRSADGSYPMSGGKLQYVRDKQPGALRILSVLHPTVEGGEKAFNMNDLRMIGQAKAQEVARRQNSRNVVQWRELLKDPTQKVEFALVDTEGTVPIGPWTSNPAIVVARIEAKQAEIAKTGEGHGWGGAVRNAVEGRNWVTTWLYPEELEAIVTVKPQEVYDTLFTASTDTIKENRRDLEVHDRQWIMANVSREPFLHFAHALGTVLVPLLNADSPLLPPPGARVAYGFAEADREFINEQGIALAETAARMFPDSVVHVFGGIELKPITVEVAVKVARAHVRNVKETWGREIAERETQAQSVGAAAYLPASEEEASQDHAARL